MNILEKFRTLPLTVRVAVCFLLAVIVLGMITIPQIMIPFVFIVGIIASLMRIFIYMTENK